MPAVLRGLGVSGVLGLAGLLGDMLPVRAEAQVSRCVDRQGNSVFTDRPCEAVDSASRVPRARKSSRADYRGACAHSLPVLIRDLTSAIESGDANRLGMLYLWDGVSDADAVHTFNRLQSIVERPLVDIVPLRREVTVALPPTATPSIEVAAAAAPLPSPAAPHPDVMQWGNDGATGGTPERTQAPEPAVAAIDKTPQTRTRTVVTGLRLQQTAGKRALSYPVVLGLRRAYDCWWIDLSGG